MYEIEKETLEKAYKPMYIVSVESGAIGFIKEVNVNRCQPNPGGQISYAITWLTAGESVVAWWRHDDLTLHCNMLVKIAEAAAGVGDVRDVQLLFNHMNR